MDRRKYIQSCWCVLSIALAGCNSRESSNERDEINPKLDLFAQVERDADEWNLTVRARNTRDWDVSIHDITIIAYSDTGEEVCREPVGNLIKNEGHDRTISVTCEGFPAIIAATAEESPCDGARIETLYWIGTDEQRGAELSTGTIVWESYYRECGEELPPQRAIDNVSRSDSTNP